VLDNYLAAVNGLNLSMEEVVQLCRNSIQASFVSASEKTELLNDLETVARGQLPTPR